MHWRHDFDTPRMREYLRHMVFRAEEASKITNTHHPYIFLNHCFEEQFPLLSYGADNIRRLHQVRLALDPEVFSRF